MNDPWYANQVDAFHAATERLRQAPNAPIAPMIADAIGALGDWLIAITMHDLANARMAWEPQREINAIFDARLDEIVRRLDAIEQRLTTPPDTTPQAPPEPAAPS